MQNTQKFALFIAIAMYCCAATAQAQTGNISPAEEYAEIASQISELLQRELEQRNIPALSIAIVDGDQSVWAQGFGLADLENETPATAATIYRVGSVSKLLNDVAVIQLVKQGKLELDTDIRQFIPEFAPQNPSGQPSTLRQLMSQHSCLVREPPVGHYFDPNDPTLEATVMSLNQT
ncbi:MAG: serine hydrolase domain-containing protein, partial [Pirellulaceae bacterium]